MAIKDVYTELNKMPASIETLRAYLDLRKDSLLESNNEYFYLCGLKIADIYLELGNINASIDILSKDLEKIDPVTFKNIYVAALERIIYAYIKKGNFKLAYKFISEKRKYIDNRDHEKVNRWYLEMAYVYGEMGQANKALSCLNAIKENLPDDDTLSYTLSNITKIYIDQNLLEDAKRSLQEALRITQDSEGIRYCNYLLAKVLLMEGNYPQASELFDSIFDTDTVEEDYLGIANEYIAELLKHKDLQKAKELLKKTSKDVSKCNDDRIKKYYLLNKVKYIALSLELNNIVDIVSEIDRLEKTISNNDSVNLLEALEDEKAFEVNEKLTKFVNNLDKVNLLNGFEFSELTLRDNIYNFLRKLEELISFEQVSICLFDKPTRVAFINTNNDFYTYDYHKLRLYERSLDYNAINQTVLEKLINNNDTLTFDLRNVNLPIIDFNTNKSLQEEQINYCLAIPYSNQESISSAIIYYAKFIDLTSIENEIILKVASTILVNKINEFKMRDEEKFDLTINNYLDNNSYALFHYQDKIYLNKKLASMLGYKPVSRYTEIAVSNYISQITRNSNINYLDSFSLGDNIVTLNYSLKTSARIVNVTEEARVVNYNNLKLYYSIILVDNDNPLVVEANNQNDQILFGDFLKSIEPKTKDIEYKFSFIRLSSSDPVDVVKMQVKNATGANCYHLDDNTYAVVLENEVNQRTLDRIVKELGMEAGIVRFPRDLVDLDDIIKFSKICLESNEIYFSDDVYQSFLNKQTISRIVNNQIDNKLDFMFMMLGTFKENRAYEVRLNIPGIDPDQDVRSLIDAASLHKYELKLLEEFKPVKMTDQYFICVSFDSLDDYINNSDKIRIYQNVVYVVDGYSEKYEKLLRILKKQHINFITDYKVLDYMPTNAFLESGVIGVAIFSGLDQEYRHCLIDFLTKLDLPVYANYQFLDYDKCIYRKNVMLSSGDIGDGE